MAGSYKHLIDDDGRYRGMSLLDHMGDAAETIGECFFIIRSSLSDEQIEQALDRFYRCSRGEEPWPDFMGNQQR